MIDHILRAIFVRRRPSPGASAEALQNYALDLAQEWGKDWLKPIQARLSKAFPRMSKEELDRLNAIAQDAMKAGHDLAYEMIELHGKGLTEAEWQRVFSGRYPWVDQKNLKHLYSTGSYYAWKDGVR